MPWFEDDAYPSGWRWERADAEPVTEMLPIIPPPAVDSPRLRIPAYAPPDPDLASTAEWAVLPAEAPTPPPVTSADYENVREADPTQEPTVNYSLRREPAILLISLLSPIVQAVSAFVFDAAPEQQAIVNAAAVAIAGAITAFLVRSDNLLPALTGAAQAIVAVVVGFGVDWSTSQQTALLLPISIVAGYIVRDRVLAPVPAVAAPQAAA